MSPPNVPLRVRAWRLADSSATTLQPPRLARQSQPRAEPSVYRSLTREPSHTEFAASNHVVFHGIAAHFGLTGTPLENKGYRFSCSSMSKTRPLTEITSPELVPERAHPMHTSAHGVGRMPVAMQPELRRPPALHKEANGCGDAIHGSLPESREHALRHIVAGCTSASTLEVIAASSSPRANTSTALCAD